MREYFHEKLLFNLLDYTVYKNSEKTWKWSKKSVNNFKWPIYKSLKNRIKFQEVITFHSHFCLSFPIKVKSVVWGKREVNLNLFYHLEKCFSEEKPFFLLLLVFLQYKIFQLITLKHVLLYTRVSFQLRDDGERCSIEGKKNNIF